jgi:hypothetical protein
MRDCSQCCSNTSFRHTAVLHDVDVTLDRSNCNRLSQPGHSVTETWLSVRVGASQGAFWWTPSSVSGPHMFSLSYSRLTDGGSAPVDAESCRRRLPGSQLRQERGTGHSVSRIERPRGDSRAFSADWEHHARPGQLPSSPTRSGRSSQTAAPTVDGLRPRSDSCPVGVGKGLLHVRPGCRVAAGRPRCDVAAGRSRWPDSSRSAPWSTGVVDADRGRDVPHRLPGRSACQGAVRVHSP